MVRVIHSTANQLIRLDDNYGIAALVLASIAGLSGSVSDFIIGTVLAERVA